MLFDKRASSNWLVLYIPTVLYSLVGEKSEKNEPFIFNILIGDEPAVKEGFNNMAWLIPEFQY